MRLNVSNWGRSCIYWDGDNGQCFDVVGCKAAQMVDVSNAMRPQGVFSDTKTCPFNVYVYYGLVNCIYRRKMRGKSRVMYEVYPGQPGFSAVRKATASYYERITGNAVTNNPSRGFIVRKAAFPSFLTFLFVFFMFLFMHNGFENALAVGLGAAAFMFGGIYIFNTEKHDSLPRVNKMTEDIIYQLESGGNVNDIFIGKEVVWALGGLGERRTAQALDDAGIPALHDLEVKDNGQVTANIDHLVTTDMGDTIMIDTKVWRKTPRFQKIDDAVCLADDFKYKYAIDTCFYEADTSGVDIDALVFAVGGTAGKDMGNTVYQVDRYHKKGTKYTRLCPVPVFFVPQHRIGTFMRDYMS